MLQMLSNNFAVVQLYVDLSDSCDYVGWKTISDRKEVEQYTEYRYISGNQEGSFNLRQITNNQKSQQHQCCSRSAVLLKENENKCFIVGMHNSQSREGIIILRNQIRNIVNQWTHYTQINLYNHDIRAQGCKYLIQVNWTHFIKINLAENSINQQGCKYLSQANWTHLLSIGLRNNKIDAQGCKYLSQLNYTHLIKINLAENSINEQGCKYLSQSNWIRLVQIKLNNNGIKDIIYQLLLLSLYPNTQVII